MRSPAINEPQVKFDIEMFEMGINQQKLWKFIESLFLGVLHVAL